VDDIQHKAAIIAIVDDDEPLREALGSVMRAVGLFDRYVCLRGRLPLLRQVARHAIYGAARIESILGSRAAREKFAALNSYAATASRNDGEWIHPSQEFDHAGT
jgi:hypothetical protein